MRTKTLLLSAAALLAGLISSQAQNVYSANVVGYYNLTIPSGQFSLLANQFQVTTTNGVNQINDVLASGFVSGNSTLLLWNGNGFNTFNYYNAADAAPYPAGWYDTGGNPCTNALNPGISAFLQNPASSNITVTLVGQVPQGNVTNTVPVGFNFYAVVPPISTNIDSAVVNFPATSGQDAYYGWTGSGYTAALNYYNAADAAPFPAGWYDTGGTLQSTNPAYWPKVGGGFLLQHFGATSNWVSSFTVQ